MTEDLNSIPEDLRIEAQRLLEQEAQRDSETEPMGAEEFAAAINAVYGGDQRAAMEDLGLSDKRVIRRYLSGERNVPPGLARELRALVAFCDNEDGAPDYRSVIEQLQKQGEKSSGMKPIMVAASILGAATANARKFGFEAEGGGDEGE